MVGKDEPYYIMDDMPGIVTTSEFLWAPDEMRYVGFWCARWKVIPDKHVPVEDFRSQERWHLCAMDGDTVILIIPSCRFAGWARMEKPPVSGQRAGIAILGQST